MNIPIRPATALAALLAAIVLLGACGGSEAPSPPPVRTTAADIVPPLMHDDGSFAASPPQAQPADLGAWTRTGLYASARQADQLAHALGAAAIPIEVECCGAEAVERTVGIVHAVQAAGDLPDSVPVLVSGADLRLAAAAANRLADGGLTHVWLVSP
jgi:hypothetical protein